MKFSTKHTRDTAVPQDYWQHANVAISNSSKLVWLGIIGIIHGIFPEIKWMQFYTSTGIFKSAKFLMGTGRHEKEIRAIFGDEIASHLIKKH